MKNGASTIAKPMEKQARRIATTSKNNSNTNEKQGVRDKRRTDKPTTYTNTETRKPTHGPTHENQDGTIDKPVRKQANTLQTKPKQ